MQNTNNQLKIVLIKDEIAQIRFMLKSRMQKNSIDGRDVAMFMRVIENLTKDLIKLESEEIDMSETQQKLYNDALVINAKFESVFEGNWMQNGAWDLRDEMYHVLFELYQTQFNMNLQTPPKFMLECWNDILFAQEEL